MRPLPTLWFPSHSYTAPLPFAAPLKFLFITGSIFSQGDQAPHLWRSLMSGKIFSGGALMLAERDRKSTRLNSSHVAISYAVFSLKKKKSTTRVRLHSNR